jgi:hypothetical protein
MPNISVIAVFIESGLLLALLERTPERRVRMR